jgi:hypothetical protein
MADVKKNALPQLTGKQAQPLINRLLASDEVRSGLAGSAVREQEDNRAYSSAWEGERLLDGKMSARLQSRNKHFMVLRQFRTIGGNRFVYPLHVSCRKLRRVT